MGEAVGVGAGFDVGAEGEAVDDEASLNRNVHHSPGQGESMEDPDNARMGSTKRSKIVAVLWGAVAVVAVFRVVLVRDKLSQIGATLLAYPRDLFYSKVLGIIKLLS